MYAKPPTAEELAGAADEELDEVEDVAEEQDDTDVEETEEVVSVADESVDISDDEFESLLDALGDTSSDDSTEKSGVSTAPRTDDEITEDEFDALLNQLHGSGAPGINDDPVDSTNSSAISSDEITEDEFEELLDKLHGETPASGKKEDKSKADTNAAASSAGAESDLITEDEFESLLDSLQSKGGAEKAEAPTAKPEPKAASAKPKPAPKPVPKPAPKAPEPEADSVKEKTANAPVTQEATVRVDTKRLDDIMNMVGELVLVRNRLVRLGLQSEDESMGKAVANLDVVTGDLQNAVMKTRMQPIKKVFGRFPRVVRDLARNMKKEVNLVLRGEETDLDKNLVEALADPLVHLVRNSVDHGVEAPDVREASGKPRMGTVILSAEQEGDHILLSIEDDGAGMDPNLLRRKAVEKGVMDADAADRLSDEEAFKLNLCSRLFY